ncbi:hypothetical protein DTO027B5_8691 [Paecilomyces variotii]|nr:hypothetical protein DTO169C6_5864 [Paecilomyces variotii]KAJ9283508.1 hypothetical protein DTO021C3_8918 [Paecilomyces variotii]KAJ9308699.1 hypothetical protein DTO217A2_1941 [Paecilomyces variotii]KAJ9320075.1 hypothetical protein DTO027B3_8911 [Paecilomyces variotii]KAJ9328444.1 hypothetical protein DTO027B5_8691 [Paecilomyces variotii]
MTTRASHDARGRLRRAKSTSSVQKRRQIPPLPEPLDPVTAKHHAMVAASRAFQRASERSSGDSRGSCDYTNGNEAIAFTQRHRPPSIRFADEGRSVSQMSIASISPSIPFTAGSVADGTTSPSILPPISEFQGLDGGDSSVPSSYRRLRKAKSMFSTRHRTFDFTDSRTAGLASGSHVQKEGSGDHPQHGSLRRSMSFFKGRNQHSQPLRHTKSHDAAIQLARDQYLRDMEHQGEQRRSSLLALKHRRGQKPLRKTIRASSESGSALDSVPFWTEQTGRGLRSKFRTLSVSTIKNGLKRVFGRATSTEQKLPHQNLYSPQSQFGDYISTRREADTGVLPETPTENNYSEGAPYEYYRDSMESRVSEAPTVRMMKSSESLCTSNSRVTSWTDSTAANTIATRNPVDSNHLCIIREYGDPAQSSGFTTPEGYVRRGYSAFSKPLRARPSAHKLDGSVDTQRVYSALMKRIDNNALQQDEQILVGSVPGGQPIPERASSVYSLRSSRSIRQVPSESSMKSTTSFFTANVRPFSTQSPSPVRNPYSGGQNRVQHNERQSNTSHYRSSRPLRESGPTFFPTSPCDKPETPSPYRRAMASMDRARDYSDDDSGSVIVSRLVHGEIEPDSPSVYSRTTGGNSPRQQGPMVHVDNSPRSSDARGMATIFESQRTKYVSPRRVTSSQPPVVSIKPSGDWQTWMSSEMARIDKHSCGAPLGQPLAREHYREDTQIDDQEPQHPESLIGHEVSKSRNPLEELQIPAQNNFSRPLYRSQSRVKSLSLRKSSNTTQVQNHGEKTDVFGGSEQASKLSPVSSSKEDAARDQPGTYSVSESDGSTQVPESPTPRREPNRLRQRYSLREQHQNSPFRDAKGVQFQSIRSRRDTVRSAKENSRTSSIPSYSNMALDDHTKLQELRSTISSKRMVDMFLNSRRQQNTTSDSSEPAFL